MIEYILILLLITVFLLILVFETEKERKKQEREIQEAYERINCLGGTTYIKQQLKTKSAGKIAENNNVSLENLNRYCQEHDTTIDKLLNEIPRDYAAEQERLRKEQERKIQEAYEIIDRLGGTTYIKQRLKTTNPEQIAQVYNITSDNLNQYCQKHGTSINQLKKEIQEQEEEHRKRLKKQRQEKERKIQEAYEKIDRLGRTTYIKQQLKTKTARKIAEKYNITTENLNQYCQKYGTSITQLQKEIEPQRQLWQIKDQQLQRQNQQRQITVQQRQDRHMQNLKNEKRMRGY